MGTQLFTATLLFILVRSSLFVLDNNVNIRIVSSLSDCSEGRIEFFNGTNWGTFSDCTKSFQTATALSLCNSLGFQLENKYWRGTNNYDKDLTSNQLIAYTTITNCTTLSTADTCSDCTLIHDLSSCDQQPHELYDIFVSCGNYGFVTKSTKYNCTSYDDHMLEANQYTSCATDTQLQDATDKKLIIILLTVAIFGSIFCVISFTLYSKHQEGKRLATATFTQQKQAAQQTTYQWPELHQAGQEIQLGAIVKSKKDNYMPPPQPMFVYQTRDTQNMDDMDTNQLYDNEDDDNDHLGYDMEEILPNVIYSKSKTASESYGLIKTQDDDEDEDNDDDDRMADGSYNNDDST